MQYHPFDPDVVRDPYPAYGELRRRAPLAPTPLGFFVVSRHRDVLFALSHPELFSSSAMNDLIEGLKAMGPTSERIEGGSTLLGTDPPAHTRLRKIVNRAFTPKRVAALETRVREIAHRCVAELVAAGEGDLVAGLAAPLPVIVIAELLGIDPDRRDDFRRWSDQLVQATAVRPTGAALAALERSFEERAAYLEEILAERRRQPRDDVISALVQAERDEAAMTEREVGNFIVLLLVAGNETTTHLIANAVLALLANSDVLAAVRRQPSLAPALVEEALRYDSPVQLTLRRATRDLEFAGGKLREGENIGLLLGSANRDEGVFEDADRFDLRRNASAHLAFGFGSHFCLGAALARLEARTALEALLSRPERFELADKRIEYPPSLITRGPKQVQMRFA